MTYKKWNLFFLVIYVSFKYILFYVLPPLIISVLLDPDNNISACIRYGFLNIYNINFKNLKF